MRVGHELRMSTLGKKCLNCTHQLKRYYGRGIVSASTFGVDYADHVEPSTGGYKRTRPG